MTKGDAWSKLVFNATYPLLGSPNPIPLYDATIAEAVTARARETLSQYSDALMLDDEALTETDAIQL